MQYVKMKRIKRSILAANIIHPLCDSELQTDTKTDNRLMPVYFSDDVLYCQERVIYLGTAQDAECVCRLKMIKCSPGQKFAYTHHGHECHYKSGV